MRRKLLIATMRKKDSGDLSYTPLPDGIKCSTGTEFIDTWVNWRESCVWEIGGYLSGSGFFQYGYSSGYVSDVRSTTTGKYQLGLTWNPLGGTDITVPTVSKFTFNIIDVNTKSVHTSLEVQGVYTELSREGEYFAMQNFRVGQQLYAAATQNMVIQTIRRTVNDIITHDYVACDYNGQLGMWDKVTDVFVGNGGTGEFVLP